MKQIENMRKRKKHLILKITAGGFIMLLLMRVDIGHWLAGLKKGANEGAAKGLAVNNRRGQGHSFLRMIMERQSHNVDAAQCQIPHLKSAAQTDAQNNPDCVRRQPSASACRLAQELFGSPSDELYHDHVCSQGKNFCSVQSKGGSIRVSCDNHGCKKALYLGMVDLVTGQYLWKSFNSAKHLEHAIQSLSNHSNGGYCLVRCGMDVNSQDTDEYITPLGYTASQILNLPPSLMSSSYNRLIGSLKSDMKLNGGRRNHINFNFIFIDSVSRHHCFRSLPKSIRVLESLSESNVHYKKPVILDFELVQGVRSRTFETLQALFSGVINPFEKPFGTQSMPRVALQTETLLKPLKSLDYKTLWLEDLCVWWEWGISKDLLVYDKNLTAPELWAKFKLALESAGIDSIGNSLASCRILHSNDHPDPFHGPDNLCYNGQHQHWYQFDYLRTYQESLEHASDPFFTFLETNVGHENSGVRIQHLDQALSEYLEFAAGLDDTLTVLLSDHGNAYGPFVSSSDEGKLEIFHPFLFMIVPQGVKDFIGDSKMASLISNQKKLVTVLDLHYTLTALIEMVQMRTPNYLQKTKKDTMLSKVSKFNAQFNVTKYGMLEDISDSRTCSHLPRIMPNLCICENYDVETHVLSFHFILAQYIIGEINNEIQTQHAMGSDHSVTGGFGSCYRLIVDHIKNVHQSVISDDAYSVKMDLFVKEAANQPPAIFFASVTINSKAGSAIQLDSFDRITPYAPFSSCADSGVELRLCICNRTKTQDQQSDFVRNRSSSEDRNGSRKIDIESLLKNMMLKESSMKTNISEVSVHGKKCLFVVSHSNDAGVAVSAVNGCQTRVRISLQMMTRNIVLSSGDTVEKLLSPRDVTFLSVGVVADLDVAWSWEMSIGYVVV